MKNKSNTSNNIRSHIFAYKRESICLPQLETVNDCNANPSNCHQRFDTLLECHSNLVEQTEKTCRTEYQKAFDCMKSLVDQEQTLTLERLQYRDKCKTELI